MTEDFTSEAMAYLLEQLDPEQRARFEERLARDPVMASAFKTCADSLAEFALEEAPERPIEWPERGDILADAVAQISEDKGRAPEPASRVFFWRAAAAVLFATNLGLLCLHFKGRTALLSSKNEVVAKTAVLPAVAPSSTGTGTAAVTVIPPKGFPNDPGKEVKKEIARLTALRDEYARLRGARDALSAESQSIMRQLAEQAIVNAGTDKFVAMQLVDAESYANGTRNPSLNLTQPILTSPGVVAAGSPTGTTATALTGTTPPAANSPSSSGTSSNLNTTVSSSTGTTVSSTPSDGNPNSPTTPANADSTPTNQTAPPTPTPNAWSLFDETDHQGFLDLSNLPQVPSDQALQLWVQPVGSQDFIPVGSIPSQFYGGSGSVYYKLPSDAMTPSQILITIEPTATPPTAPTGTTVLRGP
jgi:anti-sigma-K factor RskA